MKDEDMKNNDILNDVLNMNPVEKVEKKLPTTYRPSLDEEQDIELENDTKYVRQNFYDLIEKGHGAIDELLAVADQSQHPRAYEVLANMLKTMGDMNKDLLDMHKKKQDLTGKKPAEKIQNTQNNLYVGSTSDLLKLINKDDE